MKALSDRGMSPNAAAGQAGMNPFAARKALEHSRHFTDAELLAALRSAANTEAEMKTSPVEEGLVLERWIATVCRATPSR